MKVHCAKCAGAGSIPHETRDPYGFTFTTELCDCRALLPPREGKASWWTMEPIWSAELEYPEILVSVNAEVPISAENYRLVRYGNRYYPATVDLEFDNGDVSLHADAARRLAALLLQAADQVDAINDPDTAPCGHWAPCDCGKSVPA